MVLILNSGAVSALAERSRRAVQLRTQANQGSAIDALVVASAEPGGSVLTSDRADLTALAAVAHVVYVDIA